MRLDKLAIAAGVVGVATCMFVSAYIVNGVYQIKTTGMYIPPADMVEILREVLGASVTVLTFGGIVKARRTIAAKKEAELEAKQIEASIKIE